MRRGLLALIVSGMVIGLPTLSQADESVRPAVESTCTDVMVPVRLQPGTPKDSHIYGRLCVPDNQRPTALQVLVHGMTYSHVYWDLPGRNSYVDAANRAGYATLAIDRIGSGRSSHPLSAEVTIKLGGYTVHQVVQAVRNGHVAGPDGTPFDKVVLVGHSMGSWTLWFEASWYRDADAVVLTGATHGVTTARAPLTALPRMYPANLDPAFEDLALDPTYLTTQPGTRYDVLYAPGEVDPEVLAFDKRTKSTVAATELANYLLLLQEPLDIRAPVLLAVGGEDPLFCGPAHGGADCSSAENLVAYESPHLGPQAEVDAYVLPGAGHAINGMRNAPQYFSAVQRWIAQTV